MDKLVSIIVPVYQGEKTIERCLKSILDSTYKTLEVIVIDDGSTDKTAAIVTEMAQKDTRVKLIQTPNGGVSKARNLGLKNANGYFIGFVDADDYILPAMYEKMVHQMTDDRDLIICGSNQCDEQGNIRSNPKSKLVSYEKQCPQEALLSVLYERVTMAVWSKLFRSEKIVTAEGELRIAFSEDISNYEDFIFICEYIGLCTGSMYFLPERVYNYCYSAGSLSRTTQTFQQVVHGISHVAVLKDRYGETLFGASQLFFTETVWKYWVIQVKQHKEYKKITDFKEHEDVKRELLRYKKAYDESKAVKKYKKWIVNMIIYRARILFGIIKIWRIL